MGILKKNTKLLMFVSLFCLTLLNFTQVNLVAQFGNNCNGATWSNECAEQVWTICDHICNAHNSECATLWWNYSTCDMYPCDTYWDWDCEEGYSEYDEWCMAGDLYCPVK